MVSTAARRLDAAWRIAASVPDPELPMVTVADLGILRSITMEYGSLAVIITPTYSGCPALTEIARDLHGRLTEAGLGPVTVRTALAPAWTTDWITAEGRRKLADAGIAPPGPATSQCPLCGSADTELTAAFSGTACKALRRCLSCGEPFEQVKEL